MATNIKVLANPKLSEHEQNEEIKEAMKKQKRLQLKEREWEVYL